MTAFKDIPYGLCRISSFYIIDNSPGSYDPMHLVLYVCFLLQNATKIQIYSNKCEHYAALNLIL